MVTGHEPQSSVFFLKCHSKTLGVWACPSILDGILPTELRRESARNTWLMDHSVQAIEVRRLILFPSILHTWNDRNMAAGRLKTCHFFHEKLIQFLKSSLILLKGNDWIPPNKLLVLSPTSTHCKCR